MKIKLSTLQYKLGLINIPRRLCNVCGVNMNFERGKSRHSINGHLRCGKKIIENPYLYMRGLFLKSYRCLSARQLEGYIITA